MNVFALVSYTKNTVNSDSPTVFLSCWIYAYDGFQAIVHLFSQMAQKWLLPEIQNMSFLALQNAQTSDKCIKSHKFWGRKVIFYFYQYHAIQKIWSEMPKIW